MLRVKDSRNDHFIYPVFIILSCLLRTPYYNAGSNHQNFYATLDSQCVRHCRINARVFCLKTLYVMKGKKL